MENIKNVFIKILDKEVAQQLIKSGFSYVIEKINNEEVYVFTADDKLISELHSNFAKGSSGDYIIDNKLHF